MIKENVFSLSFSPLHQVSGAVVVSGLLQAILGLLGGPGHLFPRCGPLVLAPSLVVAGLSVYREVALLCSTHWGLASLYVSPKRHYAQWVVWEQGEGRAATLPVQQPSQQG